MGCRARTAGILLPFLAWAPGHAAPLDGLGAAGLALLPHEWALGLVAALAAALACGVLWARCLRARRELRTARAKLASARQALAGARSQAAELMRRLGQAERLGAMGTMSAQVAHQLRNPLTSMGLYLQLLDDEVRKLGPDPHVAPGRELPDEDGTPNGAEASELLRRALRELATMVEITDNYLQYARLPELTAAPLDVNRTVGELVGFLKHELERHGVAVSVRLAEGLPQIEGDRRLLGFALMNLLKNALEAMGPGGRLRVKTAQENGAVEIHVSDTGPGIPSSDLEHIFEPFYTTKEAGSGLGLPLSRQVAEKHSGSLTCQSMVGVGTTFMVRLPLRGAARRPAGAAPRVDPRAGDRRPGDGSTRRCDGPPGG
ncbi:MAG TPA: ATP-binding protein [Planctomycetota bacterium]|nr:ATP-binding protein [Planctomycetota bacterium]